METKPNPKPEPELTKIIAIRLDKITAIRLIDDCLTSTYVNIETNGIMVSIAFDNYDDAKDFLSLTRKAKSMQRIY